jgi:chorismate mutase/prephenate dehydratase
VNNIEDESDNTTRFLIIGHRSTPPSGDDKTTLIFSTTNRPGALYKMLASFAEHGISMMRIESRPSRRGMWDYFFFVDIEGHGRDEVVAEALKELKQRASMLKLLGSYPRAVL